VQRPKRVVSKAARGNRASAAKSTKREELTRGGNASLRGRQRGERENGLRVRKPEVGKRIRIVSLRAHSGWGVGDGSPVKVH
jgi:hypothetical protein